MYNYHSNSENQIDIKSNVNFMASAYFINITPEDGE
jgi:hypothetical protein